jgi:hypothetical protein
MALLFRNQAASDRRRATALDVMQQARVLLGVDEDVVVSVRENECGEPGCCGPHTVVLIMRPNERTVAVRINKPLDALTPADLSQALSPLTSPK